MIRRINQYLLTHHPLIWNTRAAWMLAANALIHLLFFVSGLAAVSREWLGANSYGKDLESVSLYVFSILCSLLAVIIWLIFYLRNNAFKEFYRIGKGYLAKEFLLMLLIVFTSVTYVESYRAGVKVKVRSITGAAEFVREVNAVNTAMAYVPLDRRDYFIGNSCARKSSTGTTQYAMDDPEVLSDSVQAEALRRALRDPASFRFTHFCKLTLDYTFHDHFALLSQWDVGASNREWLTSRRTDSVRTSLQELERICRKYGVTNSIRPEAMTAAVFATPAFLVPASVPTNPDYYARTAGDVDVEGLGSAFSFIADYLPDPHHEDSWRLNVYGHIALAVAVLLLCFKRFSRRAFLISIVGTLVWCIFIGLLVAGIGSALFFSLLCLMLCAGFLLVALSNLRSGSARNMTGALLSWHVFIVPYLMLLLLSLVHDAMRDLTRNIPYPDENEFLKTHYPVYFWIKTHGFLLTFAGWLIAIAYITTFFNRLAKRWYSEPEE